MTEDYREPNDNAYLSTETRTGPPLGYVASKMRGCLEDLHLLIEDIDAEIAPDTPTRYSRVDPETTLKNLLRDDATVALGRGLTAYLALNNMLALGNDDPRYKRCIRMSHDDFCAWLDRIDTEGSVT